MNSVVFYKMRVKWQNMHNHVYNGAINNAMLIALLCLIRQGPLIKQKLCVVIDCSLSYLLSSSR